MKKNVTTPLFILLIVILMFFSNDKKSLQNTKVSRNRNIPNAMHVKSVLIFQGINSSLIAFNTQP